MRYSHTFKSDSGQSGGPKSNLRSSNGREPRKPDWLMILMVCFFVLTLLIAWLVDIPALLR